MPETLPLSIPAPLTTLTEDEILFRDSVRQFADDKIRPLAKEMDEKAGSSIMACSISSFSWG